MSGSGLLAPLIGSVTETEHAFNPFALVVAAEGAAACLIIGNLLPRRSGA